MSLPVAHLLTSETLKLTHVRSQLSQGVVLPDSAPLQLPEPWALASPPNQSRMSFPTWWEHLKATGAINGKEHSSQLSLGPTVEKDTVKGKLCEEMPPYLLWTEMDKDAEDRAPNGPHPISCLSSALATDS